MEITVNGEIGNLFRTDSMYSQLSYEDLVNESDTKIYSDEQAVVYIADEFGFDPAKVTILHGVPLMVYNGFGKWNRTRVLIQRLPCYNSRDWNYMLFSVNRYVYEVVNGNLHTVEIEGAE